MSCCYVDDYYCYYVYLFIDICLFDVYYVTILMIIVYLYNK